MVDIDVCVDLDEARILWERHWPQSCFFDLWPVRACFQNQYMHKPHFLIASRKNRFAGMMALSWIEEEQYFGHFPGEIWQGKTWLEQNKVLAADQETAKTLLSHLPNDSKVRYLCLENPAGDDFPAVVDETGYLFYPQQYDYAFTSYWRSFSGKSRKKIRSEIKRLEASGVEFRYNQRADIDRMFQLSLEQHQNRSYFHDPRFLRAFQNLADWLQAKDMLRITTVEIGGRVAAVDMGAVWNGTYTLLAGGTHADFPGVAKLINLHHLERACARRMKMVDFLCGDFNWKERFHLSPRPLYQICRSQSMELRIEGPGWNQGEACAV